MYFPAFIISKDKSVNNNIINTGNICFSFYQQKIDLYGQDFDKSTVRLDESIELSGYSPLHHSGQLVRFGHGVRYDQYNIPVIDKEHGNKVHALQSVHANLHYHLGKGRENQLFA